MRNTHSVTVGTQLQRSVGTTTGDDYSTAKIVISTLVNGAVPSASVLGKLSIVDANKNATTDGDFKIEAGSDDGHYTLTCKRSVATGTYYVKFTSTVAGQDKDEFAGFVVVE